MNYFIALQLRAMEAVRNREKDPEAWQRHVFRWYSQTFHTPLHQVEDLDLEDVLTAYFESRYEEMDGDAQVGELKSLLETPEQARLKARQRDIDRAEAFEFARLAAQEEEKRVARKAAKKLEELKTGEGQRFATGKIPEADLPKRMSRLPDLPPDVKMTFVAADTFEELLEQGSGPKQSSKK